MPYWVHIPSWVQRLYPRRYWRIGPTTDKVLYLTFDDGPTPEITPAVLALLSRYEARASFFCIGKNVAAHPEIYRAIEEQGHRVGNHTHRHLRASAVGLERYLADIEEAQRYISSTWFRPPYGKLGRRQALWLRRAGYRIAMYDVLSADFDQRLTGQECAQNVIRHALGGSLVVFHDSVKAWPRLQEALPKVLRHFSAQGFRFAALPDFDTTELPVI